MSDTNPSVLEFTGERFTPECVREIWYEHWHRYAFALPLARGRRVLDAACGEGYGSALLAGEAASVLGVDISDTTVAHARARYGTRERVHFAQGDCTALDALPDAGFDLIVSFETLEHLHDHERMLDGFARLLADDGILLISTPDKRTYTDLSGATNEHHVRELYRDEFESLLSVRFPHHRLFGQKLLFASVLWDERRTDTWAATTMSADASAAADGLRYAPLYYVAACARTAQALDALPSLSLFGDAAQSVYSHYDHEIRKNIAAGHRIAELEQQLEAERARRLALEQQRV
ncbi:class I SAM-dependent methyltransferase [Chiayiivirga flava]|uniref:SAM-dependent methyltransferase n=1 Tax=Chiayiivirga flava TaxID=659595 RepID=A0A7W8D6A8_9GAMM|nr:class I SAM-dependent methyltransferase [Chiayiivirga flava]MBB5208708.1 SAM-dependent methyltransferase [Chiayiivirga flava]